MSEKVTIIEPTGRVRHLEMGEKVEGAPWETSKLFFKRDMPGQSDKRAEFRKRVYAGTMTMKDAQREMWEWLCEQHGGDEQ